MLRAGNAVRFVPNEVEDYRSLGIDFAGARTRDDVEQALGRWAQTLADERPDLLDKIVQAMAKPKGVRPPLGTDLGGQQPAFCRFSLEMLIQRLAIWSR